MEPSTSYFRDLLSAELARRCRRNSRYSLRAFAKALVVDVATLSRVLAGKTSQYEDFVWTIHQFRADGSEVWQSAPSAGSQRQQRMDFIASSVQFEVCAMTQDLVAGFPAMMSCSERYAIGGR